MDGEWSAIFKEKEIVKSHRVTEDTEIDTLFKTISVLSVTLWLA